MDSKKRTEKGLVGFVGLVLWLTLLSSVGYAQIPHKMNYQGYLTNAAGVPVNGTLQMVFSIYNVSSGGSPLWTETHSVTVSQGVYSVILGEGSTPNPINLPFDTTYYLGVQVGADPEMTPRKILTSVGYAFRAEVANTRCRIRNLFKPNRLDGDYRHFTLAGHFNDECNQFKCGFARRETRQ